MAGINSDLLIRIDANIKGFQSKFNELKSETARLDKSLRDIAKTSTIAFAGLSAAIGLTIVKAASFETIKTQFEVLTGSIEGATLAMKDLQEFSAETPFQFDEIASAGQKLLGFGSSVGEIRNQLRQIGDVSAAVGASLGDVTLIFGQVAAAGKLTGERLLQLQERAIPIGPAIAKTMGVAESEVRNLVSAGKVTTEVFNEAFKTLSQEGGVAFEGMAKRSKTLSGLWSTLKDNLNLLLGAIGDNFIPYMKIAVSAFTDFIKALNENKSITKTIALVLAIGTALAGLVAGLSTTGFVLIGLNAALIAFGTVLAPIATALAPFALLIGGIGLAIAGTIGALKNAAGSWSELWLNIQASFNVVVEQLSNTLGNLGTLIKAVFSGDLQGIKESWTQLQESFAEHLDVVQAIEEEKDTIRKQAELERQAQHNAKKEEQQKKHITKTLSDEEAKEKLAKQKLDAWNAHKLTAAQELEQKKGAIAASGFAAIAALAKEGGSETFRIWQAASLAEAIISGYLAVSKALASSPPPWNFVAAASVGTLAALQVRGIAQAKAPQMADGGLVMPKSGGTLANIGEAGYPEAVIPLDDNRSKEALGGLGGSTVNVTIQGNVIGEESHIDDLVRKINDGIKYRNLQLEVA